jgi:hypothetical protein
MLFSTKHYKGRHRGLKTYNRRKVRKLHLTNCRLAVQLFGVRIGGPGLRVGYLLKAHSHSGWLGQLNVNLVFARTKLKINEFSENTCLNGCKKVILGHVQHTSCDDAF